MIPLTALLLIIYISSLVSSTPLIFFPDELEQRRKEATASQIIKERKYGFWINECTQKDEMPFFNEILDEYECHPLLSQGPCEPDSWLILDKNQPNKAVCAEELCKNTESDYDKLDDYDDYDYYNDYKIFDVNFNGKCHNNQHMNNCPPGQKLLTNAFGDGVCDCMEGFLPYIEKNESFSCYQEFLQGPCPQRQQYTFPDEDTQDFEPVCVRTDCESNEIRYMDKCIPVPICKDPQDHVRFLTKKDGTGIKADCDHLHLGTRGDLISGQKRCRSGQRLDARGRCKKGVGRRRNKKRRQTITYGRGRNVRNVCCTG